VLILKESFVTPQGDHQAHRVIRRHSNEWMQDFVLQYREGSSTSTPPPH
jgi:hypothetical protein